MHEQMALTESTILEGEEKFLILSRNGRKWQGAATNRVIVRDNLTTRQVIAWLNGHVIIDTGIQQKIDLIEYMLIPIEQASVKYFVITSFMGHELRQVNRILLDSSDKVEYVCGCGVWRFFGKDDAFNAFLNHIDSLQPRSNGVVQI